MKDPAKIAHDLRNSLSIIYSYAQLLELSLQKPALKGELATTQALVEAVKAMDARITELFAEAENSEGII